MRYDSPSWHGFIFASQSPKPATTGARMLRYAGEYSGFRLAGAVGYERQ